jgi:hypothetical protein
LRASPSQLDTHLDPGRYYKALAHFQAAQEMLDAVGVIYCFLIPHFSERSGCRAWQEPLNVFVIGRMAPHQPQGV